MKYAVIDIGSNSVRLMYSDGKDTIKKFVETTRLAEGMGVEKELKTVAIDRTVAAVSFFVAKAKQEGADEVFIFATAAVRRAVNGSAFTSAVKRNCGISVDVVSGEKEAELGYVGALDGKDGAIIDVGGASTEIIVVKNGVPIYSKSVDVGAVTVTDNCGQEKDLVNSFVLDKISDFKSVPESKFFAIGGTATTMAAIILQLEPYDPKKTHQFILKKVDLSLLKDKLFSLTVAERQKLKGLQPSRAKVIASGAMILLCIMEKLGINELVISENDNLEGYLKLKLEKR